MKMHSEIKDTVRLAARFGYISQSVFRDLVTTKKRAMQYELWKRMKDFKILVPYEYRYKSEEFLRLTKRGRILASQLGVMPIHAPFVNQLPHDELLVRFILSNERALTEESALALGAFGLIHKPFNLKSLIEKVEDALSSIKNANQAT